MTMYRFDVRYVAWIVPSYTDCSSEGMKVATKYQHIPEHSMVDKLHRVVGTSGVLQSRRNVGKEAADVRVLTICAQNCNSTS